jgi:rRNA biogenesis protein RRP5
VRHVSAKGLFVTLDRDRDARVKLSNMSDGFVEDPAAAFPEGAWVKGRVVAAAAPAAPGGAPRLELSLRSGGGGGAWRQLEDVAEGEVTTGKVRRVEKYGVFVDLARSNVTGLAHISQVGGGVAGAGGWEPGGAGAALSVAAAWSGARAHTASCSRPPAAWCRPPPPPMPAAAQCGDGHIKDLGQRYQRGQVVRVRVLAVDKDKRQVSLSMKPELVAEDSEDEEDGGTGKARGGKRDLDDIMVDAAEEEGGSEEDEEEEDNDEEGSGSEEEAGGAAAAGSGFDLDEMDLDEDEEEDGSEEEEEGSGSEEEGSEGLDASSDEEEAGSSGSGSEEESGSEEDDEDGGGRGPGSLLQLAAGAGPGSGGWGELALDVDGDAADDQGRSGEGGRAGGWRGCCGRQPACHAPPFSQRPRARRQGPLLLRRALNTHAPPAPNPTPGAADAPAKLTKAQKRRAKAEREAAVAAAEAARAAGGGAPASEAEFERLVVGAPNNSYLWIRYMALLISLGEIDRARAGARGALGGWGARQGGRRSPDCCRTLLQDAGASPPRRSLLTQSAPLGRPPPASLPSRGARARGDPLPRGGREVQRLAGVAQPRELLRQPRPRGCAHGAVQPRAAGAQAFGGRGATGWAAGRPPLTVHAAKASPPDPPLSRHTQPRNLTHPPTHPPSHPLPPLSSTPIRRSCTSRCWASCSARGAGSWWTTRCAR